MKLSIIILPLVALTSCDGVNKSEFWFNNSNFDYCSDEFHKYGLKVAEKMAEGDRDSAYYYVGKANAYYEMERKFFHEMDKTK